MLGYGHVATSKSATAISRLPALVCDRLPPVPLPKAPERENETVARSVFRCVSAQAQYVVINFTHNHAQVNYSSVDRPTSSVT
jgi:hypothetical protein